MTRWIWSRLAVGAAIVALGCRSTKERCTDALVQRLLQDARQRARDSVVARFTRLPVASHAVLLSQVTIKDLQFEAKVLRGTAGSGSPSEIAAQYALYTFHEDMLPALRGVPASQRAWQAKHCR